MMMKKIYIIYIILFFIAYIEIVRCVEECYDDGVEFCIYPEDILSVDLLPDYFLFVDNKNYTESNNNSINNYHRFLKNGTIDEAFNAMGFHRKKMNEFLCHGFLAEKILIEVGGNRVKRRLDASLIDNSLFEYTDENVSVHEKLLSDEGSSKYKDWLKKTTTLDDVYRHYAPLKSRNGNKLKKRKESFDRRYDDDDGDIEKYDGAVTGYAIPAPMPTGKVGTYFPPSGLEQFSDPAGHNFHQTDYFDHHPDFYPQHHEEHIYLTNHDNYHHHHGHHKPSYHHGKGKSHDLTLRDFFEIALTALAFLAFGLFIIQLMVNISNASTVTAATFLQAPEIEATRFKRETEPPSVSSSLGYAGNEELNELSHRVLRSIEAALIAEQDGGNCLRRILCDYNKNSKEIKGGQRIWMPVWSLGMSWLSGRILKNSAWSTTLGSVKASVLGLGGADCTVLFPNCNLKQEVTKRRRRRRRK